MQVHRSSTVGDQYDTDVDHNDADDIFDNDAISSLIEVADVTGKEDFTLPKESEHQQSWAGHCPARLYSAMKKTTKRRSYR